MNSETPHPQHLAIIGAGWAGLTAAVRAVQAGCAVTVYEAARRAGGRARSVPLAGGEVLDSGQHILIGAYTRTLALLRALGVHEERAFLRLPLALRHADGSGLALPRVPLPAPLHALAGIATARGWHWGERWALLRMAAAWQRSGFACDAPRDVAQLCAALPPRVVAEFVEPLCLSALNTPPAQASAAVFLRVLHDALRRRAFSDMLLPRVPLGELLPEAAQIFLEAHGTALHLGRRVQALRWLAEAEEGQARWFVDDELGGQAFDAVLLATDATGAVRLVAGAAQDAPPALADELRRWQQTAAALDMRPITCVYARADAETARRLPPMLALHSGEGAPAQFVFNRSAIAEKTGEGRGADSSAILAFVISASSGERQQEEQQTLAQARVQLGVDVQPLHTICERRATFACTPALQRPPMRVARGLLACGDYVDGPYPATLEGAVMSGEAAARALTALQSAPS